MPRPIAAISALFLCLVVLVLVPAGPASAREISLIRDAEVENTIRTYATPLFEAAGLEPSTIRVHLVKDNRLNAFVAGGRNLFLNTGLLMRAENPSQVIGVIAHETGHIAGGHLSRTHEAMSNARAQAILGWVLGGLAVIGGRPDVGAAMVQGGQAAGVQSFLQYSRAQEQAADQAALRLLEATGQSATGMAEFLGILADQELLTVERQDPYLRTHPISQDRVEFVENHLKTSTNSGAQTPPHYVEMHRRMQAKLYAFINPADWTFRKYRPSDTSLEARYARAIAFYRKADLDSALPLIDALLAERPKDPYFHELKGQMLFENRRAAEALPAYREAARLAPDSALILTDLARVELALDDPSLLTSAIGHLREAGRLEPRNSFIWHQLGIAYGRDGQMAESSLALAEEAYLAGNNADALFHAGRAENLMARGSPGWLRAQDIKQAVGNRQE